MRTLDTRTVAAALGLPRAPADRALRGGIAAARRLATWPFPTPPRSSPQRLTTLPFFADTGFYKRAQITANDLQLAGVADFADIDRLTIFADNLVPHVLRVDGVLRYSDELARADRRGDRARRGQ